jgi:hypothetical protein
LTADLNGKRTLPPTSDPREDIAQAVQEALREDDEPTWEELTEEDREDEVYLADAYITAHAGWLAQHGWRVIPPGSIPKPSNDAEAMAMVNAAKAFFDAQKRRGKLVGSVAQPTSLILPKGGKLQ